MDIVASGKQLIYPICYNIEHTIASTRQIILFKASEVLSVSTILCCISKVVLCFQTPPTMLWTHDRSCLTYVSSFFFRLTVSPLDRSCFADATVLPTLRAFVLASVYPTVQLFVQSQRIIKPCGRLAVRRFIDAYVHSVARQFDCSSVY